MLPTRKAQALANDKGLDLVEVSPTARPPVCRIMDYGKHKYDQGKKKRMAKKSQVVTKMKEVKFHANVDDHDYEFKVRHARDFLNHGHRVKFSLFFRGRERAHQELGYDLMNRVAKDLGEDAIIEQKPQQMGRNIIMMAVPNKTKK